MIPKTKQIIWVKWSLPSDVHKFQKINLKYDVFLNFAVNKEKWIDNILKKLVVSNSLSEKIMRSLTPIETRPEFMDSLKFTKISSIIVLHTGLFYPQSILLSKKLARFPIPIIIFLTCNKFTVKELFNFSEQIVEQDFEFVMGSLDVLFFLNKYPTWRD